MPVETPYQLLPSARAVRAFFLFESLARLASSDANTELQLSSVSHYLLTIA